MRDGFAIITALLLDRPTCIECLSEKSGMKWGRVKVVLAGIGKVMRVHHVDNARCHACGEQRAVVSIDAPDDSTRSRLSRSR